MPQGGLDVAVVVVGIEVGDFAFEDGERPAVTFADSFFGDVQHGSDFFVGVLFFNAEVEDVPGDLGKSLQDVFNEGLNLGCFQFFYHMGVREYVLGFGEEFFVAEVAFGCRFHVVDDAECEELHEDFSGGTFGVRLEVEGIVPDGNPELLHDVFACLLVVGTGVCPTLEEAHVPLVEGVECRCVFHGDALQ